MEKLPDVIIRLSNSERMIINNTLLMAEEIRTSESDYQDRLGATREEVGVLLDGFRGPRVVSRDGDTFRFNPADLVLLRRAMIEIIEEGEAWPGEYSARIGAQVPEGRQLLAELETLIE